MSSAASGMRKASVGYSRIILNVNEEWINRPLNEPERLLRAVIVTSAYQIVVELGNY